jgi:hypothetical protein
MLNVQSRPLLLCVDVGVVESGLTVLVIRCCWPWIFCRR